MTSYKKTFLILLFLLSLSSNLYSQHELCKKNLDAEIRRHQETVSDLYREISILEKDNGDLQEDNSKKADCSAIERDRTAWRSKANRYKRESNSWENKYNITKTLLDNANTELVDIKTKLTKAEGERDKYKKKYESKDRQLKNKDKELTATNKKLDKTTDLLNWYRMQDALNNSLVIDAVDKNEDITTKGINKISKYKKADAVIIRFNGGKYLDGKRIKYKIFKGSKTFDEGTFSLVNGEYLWDRTDKNNGKTPKGKYRIELEIKNDDPNTKTENPNITINPKNSTFKLKKK